ncbi:calmodulin [Drosophila hydei]|uniref:Calmodulin n=1 Tax=Drosophila hydei TaxID=7224 RepID=A0A6J1M054_DROHY|nr:calmodulin [Drosophila hydei]
MKADDLTPAELQIFKEFFQRIDVDNEGEFSFKELGTVMRAIGGMVSDSDLQDMINEADMHGNGSLTLEDFVNVLLRKLSEIEHVDDLRMVFNLMDKDKDGYISTTDLRKIFVSIGFQPSDEALDDMIRDGDTDQDGVLIFEEFVNMLTSVK